MIKKTIVIPSPDDAVEIKALVDAAAELAPPAPVVNRTIFGIFNSSRMPTKRNPSAADRASTILLYYVLGCWVTSLLLSMGSILAFYHLERFELFTTSHDARIEALTDIQQVGTPDD